MPRPTRIEFPGAWYHVSNAARGRRRAFRNDDQREIFLGLIGEAWQIFRIQVHAYCLLGNGYHLLVHTPEGNLGRALRHLNGIYTLQFNRFTKEKGPLWRDRYQSVLIDERRYLWPVSRYIHLLPVQSRAAKVAELYPWSSFRAYVGHSASPGWLHTGAILGRDHGISSYKGYVDQGPDNELIEFYSRKRMPPFLGSRDFQKQVFRRWGRGDRLSEFHRKASAIRHADMQRIVDVTAQVFSVPVASLYRARPGRNNQNLPRLVAMFCARKPGGYDLAAIAREFGVTHPSTISVAMSRVNSRLEGDEELRKKIHKINRYLVFSGP